MAGEDWQKYLPAESAPSPAVDWMKYVPEETSKAGSFLRGAAQELTFGFADEIAGGLESLVTGKSYKQARNESRDAYARAESDNPMSYTAGQIGGGLASLVVPGGAIAKAAGTGAKVARAAGAGALYGTGKSEADTLSGIARDAAIGGVAGAGVYGAGRLVGAGASGLKKLAKSESPAVQAVKRVLTDKAMATAGGAIAGAIGGGGVVGSAIGAGLGMLAPKVGKAAAKAFGRGKAPPTVATSAADKWASEAQGLLAKPDLTPLAHAAEAKAPSIVAKAAPANLPPVELGTKNLGPKPLGTMVTSAKPVGELPPPDMLGSPAPEKNLGWQRNDYPVREKVAIPESRPLTEPSAIEAFLKESRDQESRRRARPSIEDAYKQAISEDASKAVSAKPGKPKLGVREASPEELASVTSGGKPLEEVGLKKINLKNLDLHAKRDPVKVVVSKDGQMEVEGGRRRILAARERGVPLKVEFVKPTSHKAFLAKVQAGYDAKYGKRPAPGMETQLGEILKKNRAEVVTPKEARGTLDALGNIVSSVSREGKTPGLKHYPVSPQEAFKGYLNELPKAADSTAKGRNAALKALILGMKRGDEPGELIYRARMAGVPDKAIMGAVGVLKKATRAPKAEPKTLYDPSIAERMAKI